MKSQEPSRTTGDGIQSSSDAKQRRPDGTHALGDGSVAIDLVPEERCLDTGGEPLEADQRGEPRDAMCDAGSFELQP